MDNRGDKREHLRVAVVILNWNGADLLEQFLPSVLDHSRGEGIGLFVADNGSTDSSLEVVREISESASKGVLDSASRGVDEEIHIIPMPTNSGFAQGYNIALDILQDSYIVDYFILVNSDVETTLGWINPLVSLLDSDSSIGALQPKILSYKEPTMFEYAGAGGGGLDLFGYPFCRGRIFEECEHDKGQYNDTREVAWASGAAMVVRSYVWNELKGFDGDFFAHMEEIDLCWRIWNAGYKVSYCGESVVSHVGGATLNYGSPNKAFLNFRNNLRMLFKNLPLVLLLPIIFIRMMLDGVAAALFLFQGSGQGAFAVLRAHIAFYRDIPTLIKKRRGGSIKRYPPSTYMGSVVFNYYLLKHKIAPKF